MTLNKLRDELKELMPDDFVASGVICDCGRLSPHFKLRAERESYSPDSGEYIYICPIVLGIQWARWNLIGGTQIDFDIKELIERAK